MGWSLSENAEVVYPIHRVREIIAELYGGNIHQAEFDYVNDGVMELLDGENFLIKPCPRTYELLVRLKYRNG